MLDGLYIRQPRAAAAAGGGGGTQSAFLAYNSSTDFNVTGDNSLVTVDFNTEVYDLNNDFASDTFTAPVDGKYFLSTMVTLDGVNSTDHTQTICSIITTNHTFYWADDPLVTDTYRKVLNHAVVEEMSQGDTAFVRVSVSGTNKIVDVLGSSFLRTYFSGALLFED